MSSTYKLPTITAQLRGTLYITCYRCGAMSKYKLMPGHSRLTCEECKAQYMVGLNVWPLDHYTRLSEKPLDNLVHVTRQGTWKSGPVNSLAGKRWNAVTGEYNLPNRAPEQDAPAAPDTPDTDNPLVTPDDTE
jgi:hypothetical protein